MIKAVIFDLDGTLIHLPIDYEKLFQEFSKIMKNVNVRPLTKAVPRLDEETKRRLFDVWDDVELSALANMTINNKGILIYNRFVDKPKALVTMQGRALVEAVLKRLGLSFNVVVTRENALDRVEQLKNAAKRLKIRLHSTLFVGDMEGDFLAAKKVGCQFLKVEG